MHRVNATLRTRELEPGWQVVCNHVPLGCHYVLDLDTIESIRIVDRDDPAHHDRDALCVVVLGPGAPGWLPLEIFKIEGH